MRFSQITAGASVLFRGRKANFANNVNWMFGNRNKPEMTIIRVAKDGNHVCRVDASSKFLFHSQKSATRTLQLVHYWKKPILIYNAIVNTGLNANDILDYFF